MKKLVSLKLSQQNVPTKIENARHYVTAITGNANFATPVPALANITTAVDELEVAYNAALAGGKALTAVMRDKEAQLDNLVTLLSHYVSATANGSDTIILSAGMNVKASSGGRRIAGFVVKQGAMPGQLKLRTDYLKGHAFIFQMVENAVPDENAETTPEDTWKQIGVSPRASFVIENLEPGKKYWFRVASVGTEGQNAWSEPMMKKVSE